MTLAMSGATPSDSGLASGFVNTTTQVGGAIGLAVLATLASERTDALRADGVSHGCGAQLGLPPRLLIGAALTAVAIAVALIVLQSDRRPASEVPQPEGEQDYYAEAA